MPTILAEVIALNLILSTTLLLLFSLAIIYFLFLDQKKRFRHQREVLELREAFTQALLLSKLEIQEQTLDHIAKELHSNISHLVSLININLAGMLPQSEGLRENVLETKSLVKQLMSELKALNVSLNTGHIKHIGLVKALENELARLEKTKKYKVVFNRSGEEFELNPDDEPILVRLSQEVLNNIISYAAATTITVSIVYTDTALHMEFTDDGIGFDVDEAYRRSAEKGSTGLLNIRDRARLIKADLQIESQQGKGTTIQINLPRQATTK